MTKTPPTPGQDITADQQVLEVISRHRSTEAVFKRYEDETGHCICCEALFEPLSEVAARYGLDLEVLLEKLRQEAAKALP